MIEKNDLDELAREIRKNIEENSRFIGRIMSEDFEPEEEDIEPEAVEL